jgi:hypothetical protein
MATVITDPDPGPARSNRVAETLVKRLIETFESRMNDDLDVKGAVDGLTSILAELGGLKAQGRLGLADVQRVSEALRKIDEVLQVFIPAAGDRV